MGGGRWGARRQASSARGLIICLIPLALLGWKSVRRGWRSGVPSSPPPIQRLLPCAGLSHEMAHPDVTPGWEVTVRGPGACWPQRADLVGHSPELTES